MAKEQKLSIDSTHFYPVRLAFDTALVKLIENMMSKGTEKADITMKCSIVLIEVEENGKDSLIPGINYKITTAITDKTDITGEVTDNEIELVRSKESGDWVLGSRVANQLSLL
jgi:hypothetical protein